VAAGAAGKAQASATEVEVGVGSGGGGVGSCPHPAKARAARPTKAITTTFRHDLISRSPLKVNAARAATGTPWRLAVGPIERSHETTD
jgi:hypothetical protein